MELSVGLDASVEKCLKIIARETNVSREELDDDCAFAELGIDGPLAAIICGRFQSEVPGAVSPSIFNDVSDVRGFIKHARSWRQAVSTSKEIDSDSQDATFREQRQPAINRVSDLASLLTLLQGDPGVAERKIFLLPDGSGSALSYAGLPLVSNNICLYGLNSPFLMMESFTTTMDELAAIFASAIRQSQPIGPYVLGGWSGGALYATEVCRLLQDRGEQVECVIVIDLPCPLGNGHSSPGMVRALAKNGHMGSWGSDRTPRWVLDHFEGVLKAADTWVPTALVHRVPTLCIIEAEDGVFATESEYAAMSASLNLTSNDLMWRTLLSARSRQFHPQGWERLYPGSRLWHAKTSGNHFTIVHPPHNLELGRLLRRLPLSADQDRTEWSEWTSSVMA